MLKIFLICIEVLIIVALLLLDWIIFTKLNIVSLNFNKKGIIEEKFETSSSYEIPSIIVRCLDTKDDKYNIHIKNNEIFNKLEIGQIIDFKVERKMNKKTGKIHRYTRAYIDYTEINEKEEMSSNDENI